MISTNHEVFSADPPVSFLKSLKVKALDRTNTGGPANDPCASTEGRYLPVIRHATALDPKIRTTR